jgi:glycosyltransferase involved in cell wall biosynthesis
MKSEFLDSSEPVEFIAPARAAVPELAAVPAVRGHVDHVDMAAGVIGGWALDETAPAERCTVVVRYRGRTVAEGRADRFREDLLSFGADGRHAFSLPLPPGLGNGGGEVEVVEKASGIGLIGSPVRLAAPAEVDEAAPEPLLLLDLSDLIFYLEHHDHLSGIQRVQSNVLNAMLEEALVPLNRLRVVVWQESEQEFAELPLRFVADLLRDATREAAHRRLKRGPDDRLDLLRHAEAEPLALSDAEAANAVVLMIGAAWVFPTYFLGVRRLKRQGAKFVALLHDLIPIVMPGMCDKGTAEVFKIFLRRVIRNADYILTVSESTRRDLAAYCAREGLQCPPAAVTKNGPGIAVDQPGRERPPVSGDYVLYVSTIEGRKNHALAVQLWERLQAELGDRTPSLVFVGRLGWRVERLVEELHEKNFLDRKVVLLSEVSDTVLAALYRHSLFTFYPSLYEGWGLPVGESLAFGKICLAARATSIPEAGGEAALYFDPNSPDEAYRMLSRLITDAAWRQRLEAETAAKYRPIAWAEVAANIVDGAVAGAARPEAAAAPLLEVGEYNFARITYLESNTVHGHEVARHIRDFSEPLLTYRRLSLDHYIKAEECLADGVWYHPEEWGRWGHLAGNLLSFRVPDAGKDYVAILKYSVPPEFLPAELALSPYGRETEDVRDLTVPAGVLRIECRPFMVDDTVRLQLRLRNAAGREVPGDPRQLGIGLARLALIEADSAAQRLEVLERLAYKT